MEKVNIVFVVLVYRNYSDLKDFLESLKPLTCSYKVVVVNGFYDQETADAIKAIAVANQCEYIEIENKGYGYGNNKGIEFANAHYEYEYVVVSNPDIMINEFDFQTLKQYTDCIIAPKIICKSGHNQNPYLTRDYKLRAKLYYKGYKNNNKIVVSCGIWVNRFCKLCDLILNVFKRKPFKIFAAHGSFVIFSKTVARRYNPIYDDHLFLFCEEDEIAHRFELEGIPTLYCPKIIVNHKEDGSMKLESQVKINNIYRDSYIYVYEKWYSKINKKGGRE